MYDEQSPEADLHAAVDPFVTSMKSTDETITQLRSALRDARTLGETHRKLANQKALRLHEFKEKTRDILRLELLDEKLMSRIELNELLEKLDLNPFENKKSITFTASFVVEVCSELEEDEPVVEDLNFEIGTEDISVSGKWTITDASYEGVVGEQDISDIAD